MLLYLTNEIQTVGSNNYSLFLIYLVAVFLAISVIVVKSPVVSILYLIGLFCTVAVYLVVSGMTFAGLIYLLVYVGAISILFIFIVMLLNVRISELLTEGWNSTVLAIISVLSIDFIFSEMLPVSEGPYNIVYDIVANANTEKYSNVYTDNNELSIAAVTAKSWDNSLAELSHMSSIGNVLYNVSIMPLLIVAFIILVSMVGAIVITVKSTNKLTENHSNINISTNINS